MPALRLAIGCMVALGLCSCSSARPTAALDPLSEQSVPVKTDDEALAAATAAGQTALAGSRDVKMFEAPFANPIQQAAHTGFPEPSPVDHAVQFSPAEGRAPIVNASHQAGGAGSAGSGNTLADMYPDEYLLDGGDRGLPVHYGPNTMRGLNTEDTVAEFSDDTGERHVLPSNQVAVYSPKFGSMRTVSTPQADTGVRQLAATTDAAATAGLRSQEGLLHHAQRDALDGLVTRSRVSGLDGDTGLSGIAQTDVPVEHVKMVNAIENLKFVLSGQFIETESAALAYGIQAAAVWTRAENPVILATDQSAQGLMGTFRPQEIVGLENEHLSKGELRIVKLADRKTAQAGDVITFTIRYDNLGDRELREVRILDNLTPRLAYIDQSATSDRAGRLVVNEDDAGTAVLVFEVDEPLAGHTGGVVTFKTRVR